MSAYSFSASMADELTKRHAGSRPNATTPTNMPAVQCPRGIPRSLLPFARFSVVSERMFMRGVFILVGYTISSQNGKRSSPKNPKIHGEGFIFPVERVQLYLFLDRQLVSAVDLRPTGQSRRQA